MLSKLLKENIRKGDYVTFFMDKGRTTFRTRLMDEYKAHRPPTPEALREQMKEVPALVEGFGMPVHAMEGYEADDLIATFSKRFAQECDEVWILTSDKDLCQLVGGSIKMLRAEKGITDLVVYDEEKVREKYGIAPCQMVDYLSITGDKSDNVPGVAGIGEKGALQLLKDFATLEDIYSHIEKVPDKLRAKLEKSREDAFLSKRLVTLEDAVPIPCTLEELQYLNVHTDTLLKQFREYEFRSLEREWMPGLFSGASGDSERPVEVFRSSLGIEKPSPAVTGEYEERDYSCVRDQPSFDTFFKILKNCERCGFDTETDSLNTQDANLVGISVSFQEGKGYYLPVAHKGAENLSKEAIKEFFDVLKGKQVIGHNLKYDFEVLKHHEYPLPEDCFDTMIAAYLLDPDRPRYKLDALIREFGVIDTQEFKALMARHPFARDFSEIPLEEATRYSVEDADFSFRLYQKYAPALRENGLIKLFEMVEMPLIKVLVEMETTGVYFDERELKELSERMDVRIKWLKQEIIRIAGVSFNLDSPIQLGKILFEKLGIPSKKSTAKSKNYSTDKSVLEELAAEYEIAAKLLEYRKYTKLKTTYIDAIPQLIHPKTHRVHTSFNQTGTATGRLSSSEPNLQNLPVKNEEGKEIRAAIKPQNEGWLLVSADYSQIELRIMALLSQDDNLLKAFPEHKDIHTYTASKLFKIPLSGVSEEQRRIGKMINFSIIYGVSAFGLSSRLGLTRKESGQFIDAYFEAYPGIKRYMNDAVAVARETGLVRTLFGRLRHVKFIEARNQRLRQEAERIAINTPVQGTAADLIKIAMVRIEKNLREKSLKARLILQVHDELVFEVPEEEVPEIKKLISYEMEHVLDDTDYSAFCDDSKGALRIPVQTMVPLKVDIDINTHY
jgi:DNA polymerase-1